jgi:hypothetical protein
MDTVATPSPSLGNCGSTDSGNGTAASSSDDGLDSTAAGA